MFGIIVIMVTLMTQGIPVNWKLKKFKARTPRILLNMNMNMKIPKAVVVIVLTMTRMKTRYQAVLKP